MEAKRRKLEDLGKLMELNKSIPSEIVMYHILPSVPVKPLFRFKLVCKEWYTLISSDPIFRTIQSQRCLTLPPAIIYLKHYDYIFYTRSHYTILSSIGRDLGGIPDPSLRYMDIDSTGRNLLASSNGLICTVYRQYFCVTNPITKEFVRIPNSCRLQGIALAFEPFNCTSSFSLVGQTITRGRADSLEYCFTVYSSEKGKWTLANATVSLALLRGHGDRPYLPHPVFTGGKVFWKLNRHVLWFNIKEDRAGSVAVPDAQTRIPKGAIGDCEGELSYTMMTVGGVQIWVLKSNEKTELEWVQKYFLRVGSIFDKDQYPYQLKGMLDIRPFPYEGGDMVMLWVQRIYGKGKEIVLFYNMKTRSLKLIPNTGKFGPGMFLTYKASLASLPFALTSSLTVPKFYVPL